MARIIVLLRIFCICNWSAATLTLSQGILPEIMNLMSPQAGSKLMGYSLISLHFDYLIFHRLVL